MIFAVHFTDPRNNKKVLVAAFLMLSDAECFLKDRTRAYYEIPYTISQVDGWVAFVKYKTTLEFPHNE
jgi:hypothetical protein